MMKRRRFLAISAAFAASPTLASAQVQDWHGKGLGAALHLRLVGVPAARAALVWHGVERVIAQIEQAASLHQDSALRRLNRDGKIFYPGPDLAGLMTLSTQVHRATNGAFDPSVQPLWLAQAQGTDTQAAAKHVGWGRVTHSKTEITLPHGMALSFNGIAQGWAADRIAKLLRAEGFRDVLIDMGEVIALGHSQNGTPWRAAITAPDGAELARVDLSNRALATSSPRGTLIGQASPHILHPKLAPLWSTVSVSAPTAALADALSTAFCLMPRPAINTALSRFPQAALERIV
ncbi:FAD:protein FMN transferase [Pseudorhodobacter turbinis]|uniref:FAD:protein FMN transferase n=1 Tax=Pseudorhodobacter turbinis TaxID=2500533 RepID=A0A4P8EHF9_9RHOB|nr:FAD:protein FMN transferase [Pseudorhodobacter turbinis]QCO56309.1 FAD:protein FMN transferase [Pseudorhodobacter turbinis]